ncbi:MAG: addiction module antitoxin [Pseudomonadota bacterium]
MHKKLTITVDEEIYEGLYATIGSGKISQFIENLIKPYVLRRSLIEAYESMARDETREREANEWNEGLIGDINDVER